MSKQDALRIFRAALRSADPEQAVLRHLDCDGVVLRAGRSRYRMDQFARIFVIGAGKASAGMARAIEKLLGRKVTAGLINVPDGTTRLPRRIKIHPASHPIPDERGVEGAQEILALVAQAGPRDLVICLISGGASALLPAPAPPLTLKRKREITSTLLRAGADIHELNTVRKHISLIKGGRLAAAAWPGRMLTLILSDVIGDDLDVIGSGPTVPDPTSVEDAQAVLRKYGLDAPLVESPKPGDPKLGRVQNLIVGGNRLALDAGAKEARKRGYRPVILSSTIDGETREIARMHAAIAREVHGPVCLLSGGETTVTVRGKGLGGRNQEFVLAAAIALKRHEGVTIFSAGTDGIDGPTDAAGAVFNSGKIDPSARCYLDNNDSYRFFERFGGLIKTGPTGTNVMDVRILLVN